MRKQTLFWNVVPFITLQGDISFLVSWVSPVSPKMILNPFLPRPVYFLKCRIPTYLGCKYVGTTSFDSDLVISTE